MVRPTPVAIRFYRIYLRNAGNLIVRTYTAASGAQRKHVTLPIDFRSPSENGHSRYGQLTARFAPHRTFVWLGIKVGTGWKPDLGRDRYGRQARARFRTSLLKSLWRDPLRLIKSTPKNVTIALPDTAQFIDFAQRALG